MVADTDGHKMQSLVPIKKILIKKINKLDTPGDSRAAGSPAGEATEFSFDMHHLQPSVIGDDDIERTT